MARPHCRNRDACSAKGSGHCRPCAAASIMLNPANRERQKAGLREFFGDPERSAKHIAAACRNVEEYRSRPGVAEHLRERMKGVHVLSQTPEVQEKLRASAAARGRKRTATVLPWCPPEYLDDYRVMVRKSGYTAQEARAIIEQQMRDRDPFAQARRAIATFNDNQRAREERRKREAY